MRFRRLPEILVGAMLGAVLAIVASAGPAAGLTAAASETLGPIAWIGGQDGHAYDYRPDLARPPPVESASDGYDTPTTASDPAGDASRASRAFLGSEVRGVAPRHADDLLGAACRANSFIPGTAVLMADGTTKAIEDVEIGDYVWATDPETREAGPRPVIDTIVGDGEKHLVDIQIDGDVITITDQHPFWVDDQGRWIDAEDLRVGDHLELADGTAVAVEAVADRVEVRRVHNLTVDGIHTYFVVAGDSEVLVHNCGTIDPSSVRFSQNSISGTFRDGGSVDDLISGLRRGAIDPSDVPAVRLVERNGQLVSIDNRRLYAFQQAGVPIPFRMATPDEVAQAIRQGKFTSTTSGTSIRVRGG